MPVRSKGQVIGAVRVAYTLTQIQQNLSRIRETLLMGVTVFAVLIVLLTIRLAGSIVKPVEDLNRGAQQIARGDWTRRLHVNGAREISNLAESLNQMTRRLEQLESNRQLFVSNVSHELRTPLAAIRSMAETLIEHGKTDPTLADRYLPRITEQTDRLARLTSQLLDLAEIESGNLVLSPQPIALAEVVDDALRTTAGSAQAKGVPLVINLSPQLPDLRGDRDRLVRVFINLLDNAIRHTPPLGTVTIAAAEEGGHLVVTVTDTGEGIFAEHLPRLFERFYRVDKARSRQLGGTGLGLSVVDQIIRAHGGVIDVTSEVGRGTCFTLRLPLPQS
jgi:signal transduction histidine kinase